MMSEITTKTIQIPGLLPAPATVAGRPLGFCCVVVVSEPPFVVPVLLLETPRDRAVCQGAAYGAAAYGGSSQPRRTTI